MLLLAGTAPNLRPYSFVFLTCRFDSFSNTHHGYAGHKRELIRDCERDGLRGRQGVGAVRVSRGYDGGVIAVRRLVPVGPNLISRLMELENHRATFRRPPVDVHCNESKFRTGPRIVGSASPMANHVFDNVIGA